MSHQVLLDLQAAHAFDAAPLRHDLGIYHVPYGELTGVDSPEDRLRGVADRGERTVVVGRPGSGKSSLIEHVLGPTAEGVAPILVPVSGEPSDLAGNVQGVAGLIIQTIVDHSHLPERDRTSALESAASTRSVQPSTRTNRLTLGGAWMGAELKAAIDQQVPPTLELPRTAQASLEVVDQLLTLIQGDHLMPVLVFDDTDRWFRGDDQHERTAQAFFSRVLPELRERPAGLVVSMQSAYLDDDTLSGDLRATFETRIDIPALTSTDALARVLQSRVVAHAGDVALSEVIDQAAVDRLYDLYHTDFAGALRDVIRTAHVALTEACNNRFPTVTVELIDQAAAW
jgi:energy-coupling factor transporter ATP-binding protein EcfA2